MVMQIKITNEMTGHYVEENKKFNLSLNWPTDDISSICEFLNQNPQIKCLDTHGNRIGDKGAKLLASNTTLTELIVDANDISDKGAKALAENKNIVSLSLNFNNIGDKGAQALATNTSINSLWCIFNKIGVSGVCALLETDPIKRANYGRDSKDGLKKRATITPTEVPSLLRISAFAVQQFAKKNLQFKQQTEEKLPIEVQEIINKPKV